MNYARTHRSCAEAFGPYNGSSQCEVVPLPDTTRASDWALYAIAVGVVVALVVGVI